MKKAISFIGTSVIIILLLLSILFFALIHSSSKNYIYIKNSQAKELVKYSQSTKYRFKSYCENNSIPQTEIVFLSGVTTNSSDIIIQSNEFCDHDVNISCNPSDNTTINYYWIIKIDNNIISDIWTSNVPLGKEQLNPYSFEEQIKNIPVFKKDRMSYAIGYYHNTSSTDN